MPRLFMVCCDHWRPYGGIKKPAIRPVFKRRGKSESLFEICVTSAHFLFRYSLFMNDMGDSGFQKDEGR